MNAYTALFNLLCRNSFWTKLPQTHDPEIDENGEAVDDYKLPETLEEFALETKV